MSLCKEGLLVYTGGGEPGLVFRPGRLVVVVRVLLRQFALSMFSRSGFLRFLLIISLVLATAYQAGVVVGQVDEGATLTVLRGTVSLLRPDGSAVQPAPSGTVVHAGDRIATVGSAGALVTFFVGTEIELGADTTIAVQDVRADSSGRLNITVENVLGSTVHKVATLSSAGSSYVGV
jgi:hypothetical protein